MYVRLWMTANPVTVSTENSVADVIEIFRDSDFRLLPVLDADNHLVGIISQRDGLNYRPSLLDGSSSGSSPSLLTSTKVDAVMTPHPFFVEPFTPLEEAAQTMRREKIGGLPVLEDGKLVGILSESDIFRAFSETLGVNCPGVRVEMIISKKSEAVYKLFNVLKRNQVNLLTVTFHNDFGENQRLVTIKTEMDNSKEVLQSLRDNGVQINRVTEDTTN